MAVSDVDEDRLKEIDGKIDGDIDELMAGIICI